jgi:hypothetical protein
MQAPYHVQFCIYYIKDFKSISGMQEVMNPETYRDVNPLKSSSKMISVDSWDWMWAKDNLRRSSRPSCSAQK